MSTFKMESRAVLAAAYGRALPARMLTHAVVLINDRDAFVCCKRVEFDNLADGCSLDEDGRNRRPTCRPCKAAWDKWKRTGATPAP